MARIPLNDPRRTWEDAHILNPDGGKGLPVEMIETLGVRVIHLPEKGDLYPAHDHKFPHLTCVLSGAAWFNLSTSDDKRERVLVNQMNRFNPISKQGQLLVAAKVLHEIVADEDNTLVWCLFAHRGPHGEMVNTPHDPEAYY